MQRYTMALQATRNWSLVSFERVWKGPVFLIQRMLTPALSVLGRIFMWLLRVWPKIRSLAPSSTPNRHVIANCVFRDAVHRINQGAHFQIVIGYKIRA